MSYFDHYRDPQNEGQRVPIRPTDVVMGTTAPADVHVNARQPGESNAPHTHSAFPASRGHKLPPVHVRAAHRRNVLITGATGESYGHAIQHQLQVAVEGDRTDPANHRAAREKSLGVTVGSWARASERSGHLGGGVHLGDPANTLKRVFGVS